jgi:hypothetical protein
MDEKLRLDTLSDLEALQVVPPELRRPGMAFMAEMHGKYHVELGALEGRSALDRPYHDRDITIAQRFWRDVLHRDALFPEDLMEIDRTLMNVFNGRTLLLPDRRISHAVITDCQTNPAIRLTEVRHGWLSNFAYRITPDAESWQTMETGLFGMDLGKSENLRKDMELRRGLSYADHDRLLLDLMEDTEAAQRWYPSFFGLSNGGQATLRRIWESGYHMPQSFQGENLPVHMVKFLQMSTRDQLFGLHMGLLDISGAEGDRVQNGSVTLNEPVVAAFQTLVEALLSRPAGGATGSVLALHIESTYLRNRAAQWNFDTNQPYGRELARLGCCLRFSRQEQMDNLLDVLNNRMQPEDRSNLMELMGYTGFEPNGYAWVMYLPALIRRQAEKLQEAGLPAAESWDIALTLAAHTYQAAKQQIDLSPGVVVVAKDLVHALDDDPAVFLKSRIRIRAITSTEVNAEFEPLAA